MNEHALISLPLLYRFCGILLAVLAARTGWNARHPRRWGSAIFWFVLAVIFLGGERMPAVVVGYGVVVVVVLAATGQVTVAPVVAGDRKGQSASNNEEPAGAADGAASVARGPRPPVAATDRSLRRPATPAADLDPAEEAKRLGNRVFYPALLVPAVAVVASPLIGKIRFGDYWLGDPKQSTLAALGLGALVGLIAGVRIVGAKAVTPLREGSRLVELLGWSLVLPQLLAALGGLFQQCGVGAVVAALLGRILPSHSAFVAVAAYCLGMALFTICVGNAFAAFAVITGGIGLPLIVHEHHGNPAIMAALGMLSGYCGTLVTPMAANFNLVPVLLLDLPDRNAVIKAQAPIAGVLLLANVIVMYVCVYRY